MILLSRSTLHYAMYHTHVFGIVLAKNLFICVQGIDESAYLLLLGEKFFFVINKQAYHHYDQYYRLG